MSTPHLALRTHAILVGALVSVAGVQKVIDPSRGAELVRAILGHGDFTFFLQSLGIWEICAGTLLMMLPNSRIANAAVLLTLAAFTLVLVRAWEQGVAADCGCVSAPLVSPSTSALAGVVRNFILLAVMAANLWAIRSARGLSRIKPESPATAGATRVRGLTLAELLVVLAIIMLLTGVLLPVLAVARERARMAACASNERQIGGAFHLYANDHGGYVPRDHTPWRGDRRPAWMAEVARYMGAPGLDDVEDEAEREVVEREQIVARTGRIAALHCPSHPLAEIPAGYVVNAFKFESEPAWDPDGPVRLSSVRNPTDVAWLVEAADRFAEESPSRSPANFIYWPRYADAWHAEHLPRRSRERISDDRHLGRANVLWFDASVRPVHRGGLTLPLFDDGIRRRGTEDSSPMTGNSNSTWFLRSLLVACGIGVIFACARVCLDFVTMRSLPTLLSAEHSVYASLRSEDPSARSIVVHKEGSPALITMDARVEGSWHRCKAWVGPSDGGKHFRDVVSKLEAEGTLRVNVRRAHSPWLWYGFHAVLPVAAILTIGLWFREPSRDRTMWSGPSARNQALAGSMSRDPVAETRASGTRYEGEYYPVAKDQHPDHAVRASLRKAK